MSLYATLSPGYVSVYGVGSPENTTGLTPNNTKYLFGTVDKVWDNGNLNVKAGDSVMFNSEEVVCIITYGNWPYTIIQESKIIVTEMPPT